MSSTTTGNEGNADLTRKGDHIDLWNEKALARVGSFISSARVNLGSSVYVTGHTHEGMLERVELVACLSSKK